MKIIKYGLNTGIFSHNLQCKYVERTAVGSGNCQKCIHCAARDQEKGVVICNFDEEWRDNTAPEPQGEPSRAEQLADDHTPPMQEQIRITCNSIKRLLLEKNKAYGNSAAEPVRIFSKADPLEQIKVRIDDKISRLAKGNEYPGDDTVKDLAGYLILLLAVQEYQSK